MKFKSFVFLFILLQSTINIYSYDQLFRRLTIEEGLPSNEVYHIFQDSKGFIWIATDQGVCRYNGKKMEIFNMDNGLPDNTIFEIFEDYKGRIWFIPFSSNLSYFYNDKIFVYPYSKKIHQLISTLPFPVKKSFWVDSEDNIFISIYEEGIFRISNKGIIDRYLKISNNDSSGVSFLLNDFTMCALIGKRKLSNNSIRQIFSDTTITIDIIDEVTQIQEHIFSLRIDSNKFINTVGRLIYRCDSNGFTQKKILKNEIIWLSHNENYIFLGLKKGGLRKIKIDSSDLEFCDLLLPNKSVTSVLYDNQGLMWVTTLEDGVYCFLNNACISNNLVFPNEKIKCIEVDRNDRIWIGGENGFLGLYQNSRLYQSTISVIKDYYINCIYDNHGVDKVWVMTDRLTIEYPMKNANLCNFDTLIDNDNIFDIYGGRKVINSNDSGYWIANPVFLSKIGSEMEYIYNSSIEEDLKFRVDGLYEDSDNSLLIGTLKGLGLLFNNQISFPFKNHNILSSRVVDICQEKGTYFLGTRGNGLLVLNEDTLIQISTKGGLSNNSITSMCFSEEFLWVGTYNGLNRVKYNFTLGKVEDIILITESNGLMNNKINQIKVNKGKIYVVVDEGVSIFGINEIGLDTFRIPIEIDEIIALGDIVQKMDTSFIPFSKNNLTFILNAISFKKYNNITYKYRLLGLDNFWNYSKEIKINYPFLYPGNYTFEVYAINPDGFESKDAAKVNITILPPYWRKIWFRYTLMGIGAFIILILIIGSLRRIIVNRKKQKKIKSLDFGHWDDIVLQNVIFRERMLYQQISPHFIFNALNSIRQYISLNEKAKSGLFIERFSKLMRHSVENNNLSFIELSDEIVFLKQYLELELVRMDNLFTYSILDLTNTPEKIKIPPMIIQPFVENAVWHGFKEGFNNADLSIIFTFIGENLVCKVKDNGVGYKSKKEKDDKTKSFGISVTKKRINLINQLYGANVKIRLGEELCELSEDSGTLVEIILPIVK